MNIREKLETIKKLNKEIAEYFDAWIECPVAIDCKWMLHGTDEVSWGEDLDDEDETTYSLEICGTSVWRGEEFTMVYGDDGCGCKYHMIFDNSLEVK